MKLKLLLFLVILTAIGYGALWAGYTYQVIPPALAERIPPSIADHFAAQQPQDFSELTQSAQQQIQSAVTQAIQTTQTSQNILGEYIEATPQEDQALHQKAFEYGRYLYCQQVVEEWQKTTAN